MTYFTDICFLPFQKYYSAIFGSQIQSQERKTFKKSGKKNLLASRPKPNFFVLKVRTPRFSDTNSIYNMKNPNGLLNADLQPILEYTQETRPHKSNYIMRLQQVPCRNYGTAHLAQYHNDMCQTTIIHWTRIIILSTGVYNYH